MSKKRRQTQAPATQNPEARSPNFSSTPKLSSLGTAVFAAVVFLCFVTGAVLRVNAWKVPDRTPDESTYQFYAQKTAQSGIPALAGLVKAYNANPEQWMYPPPTRAGYVLLGALMHRMTGGHPLSGVFLSTASSLALMGVVLLIALRFFDRWTAFFALLFMTASPIELSIARRYWQDGVVALFASLMIYASLVILTGRLERKAQALFIVTGFSMIWLKESGGVFYGLCTVFLLIGMGLDRSWKKGFFFAAMNAAAVTASVVGLIAVSGGWAEFKAIFDHIAQTVPTNTYAVDYQNGPWHYFVNALWILMPVMTVSLALSGVWTLWRSINKPSPNGSSRPFAEAVFLLSLSFAIAAIVTGLPHFKNLRYLSPVYAPLYVLSGWGVAGVIRYLKESGRLFASWMVAAVLVYAALMGAFRDYGYFKRIIVKQDARDLVIRQFKEAERRFSKGAPDLVRGLLEPTRGVC